MSGERAWWLQKLARGVERTERQMDGGEGLRGAFLAVDHVNTSATSAPASRKASTAFIAEPPVVVTSSTTTMRLPSRLSSFARPSIASRAPCSFGFLRTKNAAIGWPLIQE